MAETSFEETTVDRIVKLAQVRRNSFYEQFKDKRACFTAAYEIAQERLLGVLTYQCYTRVGLAERVSAALGAGLELLADEPALSRLIVIEAPAAGGEIAVRHQEWLDRYARMLRFAAIGNPDVAPPRPALEPAIVGGIVSRVKQLVLAGESKRLPKLCDELVQLTLSYYCSPEVSPMAPPASLPSKRRDSSQPQSPERSVLEPA